jgi:hypothetical protein
LTAWLADAERLPATAQAEVAEWIESGVAPAGVRARVRWIASTTTAQSGPPLVPALDQALAKLVIDLPDLRARGAEVALIAREVVRGWCIAHHVRERTLAEDALAALDEYPWPGNLRELDTVITRALIATSDDPISAASLGLPGEPLADAELEIPELEIPAEPAPEPPASLFEPILETTLEPETERPGEPAALATPADETPLSRMAAALSHEVRNPLATIRTFASLLPERFDDPNFRDRFAEMVRHDVSRIDGLVERVAQLGDLGSPVLEKVDVAQLLEDLLEERESVIRERRLLVLKELDTSQPFAWGDRGQLRFAFEGLLNAAFELVPERGDLYLASRHHTSRSGEGSVRTLIRFHGPEGSGSATRDGLSLLENSLEPVIAEAVLRAQGGQLTISATDGDETLLVIDLPAP